MSGGAWEYVMGNYNNTIGSSGLSSMPESKYYDKYLTYAYTSGILGDATEEMGSFGTYLSTGIAYNGGSVTTGTRMVGSWYFDDAIIVNSTGPWFIRGGCYYYGSTTGVFNFCRDTGGAGDSSSFRLVLSPNI